MSAKTILKNFNQLGIWVKEEWIHSCFEFLKQEDKNFDTYNLAKTQDLVYEQFLYSDLNLIGNGNIFTGLMEEGDDNFTSLHKVVVKGPYVIQIDEIVDIATPTEEQILDEKLPSKDDEDAEQEEADVLFQDTMQQFENNTNKNTFKRQYSRSRMLKMSCTDGKNRIFATELKYIPSLSYDSPPGTKICIKDVLVRRGLLLLMPECIQVLGGRVDELVEVDKKKKELLKARLSGKHIPKSIKSEVRNSMQIVVQSNQNPAVGGSRSSNSRRSLTLLSKTVGAAEKTTSNQAPRQAAASVKPEEQDLDDIIQIE